MIGEIALILFIISYIIKPISLKMFFFIDVVATVLFMFHAMIIKDDIFVYYNIVILAILFINFAISKR